MVGKRIVFVSVALAVLITVSGYIVGATLSQVESKPKGEESTQRVSLPVERAELSSSAPAETEVPKVTQEGFLAIPAEDFSVITGLQEENEPIVQ